MFKALQLRDALKVELESFASPFFTTLTINQDRFSSPEEALEWIQTNGTISEFVRSVRRRGHLLDGRYFVCLEFQENGWPHWHLVFDAARIPFDDLVDAWTGAGWAGRKGVERWGPRPRYQGKGQKPAFGGVRFRQQGRSELGAICHYLTKYLTKIPDLITLQWVRDRTSVRRWSTSRDFWRHARPPRGGQKVTEFSKLRDKYFDPDENWEEDDEFLRKIGRSKKTIGERLDSCGSCSVVLEEVRIDRVVDGSPAPYTSWRYVGMIKAPVWEDPHLEAREGGQAVSTFKRFVHVERTSFVVDDPHEVGLLRYLAGQIPVEEVP
jgi:hypothetical protein